MKKIIFLFIFTNIFLTIYANGIPDRNRQSFGAIQLKIVNLTDNTIYFYFNRLYNPTEIKSSEEYVTMNMLVSHVSTPLGIEVPSFIGIQYTDENISIYSFRYRSSEIIFTGNKQYIVVVKDSDVNFIEGNIDDKYDYFDESLYQTASGLDWYRERLAQHFIEFKIENHSGEGKVIWIYTICEDLLEIMIDDEMSEIYTIDNRLLQLGGMRMQIVDNGFTVDQFIFKDLYQKDVKYPGIVEIKLNTNGYEINYKNHVSWFYEIRNRPYQLFYNQHTPP
jgi:hypothetical protein